MNAETTSVHTKMQEKKIKEHEQKYLPNDLHIMIIYIKKRTVYSISNFDEKSMPCLQASIYSNLPFTFVLREKNLDSTHIV